VETSVWEKAKKKQFEYQRRSPEQSPLYRLVFAYREELEFHYSELFEHRYGALRSEVLETFDEFLNCGILRHGCAVCCCEKCPYYRLIAFSCKKRGICTSCAAKRACISAENLHENVLLPYRHAHQVYTIPKRLRIYFKFNRRLNKYLYWAAWRAWKTYVKRRFPEGKTGAVIALHSAGDLLRWHPHLHGIFLLGVIDDDGVFHELEDIDTNELETLFSEYLFGYLLAEGLITDDVVENMKSWEHSGFNVFSGQPVEPTDADQRRFLARYLMKPPLSGERIDIDETGLEPLVRYTKTLDDGEQTRAFSPLEFLAEIQQHVPAKWEQLNHYYGTYASRTRGELRKQQLDNTSTTEPLQAEPFTTPLEPPPRPSSLWQACMKRIFEVDPLICPKCNSPMKIKSFVHDSREIKRLTLNLGIQDWRAPPPFALNKESHIDYSFAQDNITTAA